MADGTNPTTSSILLETMTAADLAPILHRHPKTVVKMARNREIPCKWVGRSPLFIRSQIEKWLLDQEELSKGAHLKNGKR